jgi:phosphatidylinositol N-acetylglucosaminyltransferase subunit H
MDTYSLWDNYDFIHRAVVILLSLETTRYQPPLSTETDESLLIIRSLGVQSTSRRRFRLFSYSRFIPASQIDDVFLYEGIHGVQVRYYLGVVVHGEETIEVLFPVWSPVEGT